MTDVITKVAIGGVEYPFAGGGSEGQETVYVTQAEYDALTPDEHTDYVIYDTNTSPIGIDAESVSFDNTTSGLTATNVQDAIDELASSGDSSLNIATETFEGIAGESITGGHLVKFVDRSTINQFRYELGKYTEKRFCKTIIGSGVSSNSISLYLKKEGEGTPEDITVTISDSRGNIIATETISSSDVSTSGSSVTVTFSDNFTLELGALYTVSLEVSELDNDNYYIINENGNIENGKTYNNVFLTESNFSDLYYINWDENNHAISSGNLLGTCTGIGTGTTDVIKFDYSLFRSSGTYSGVRGTTIVCGDNTISIDSFNNAISVNGTTICNMGDNTGASDTHISGYLGFDLLNGVVFFSDDYIRGIPTTTYNLGFTKQHGDIWTMNIVFVIGSSLSGVSFSNMGSFEYNEDNELKIVGNGVYNNLVVNAVPPASDIMIAQNNVNIGEKVIIEVGGYSKIITGGSGVVYISNDGTTTQTVTDYGIGKYNVFGLFEYFNRIRSNKYSITTGSFTNSESSVRKEREININYDGICSLKWSASSSYSNRCYCEIYINGSNFYSGEVWYDAQVDLGRIAVYKGDVILLKVRAGNSSETSTVTRTINYCESING